MMSEKKRRSWKSFVAFGLTVSILIGAILGFVIKKRLDAAAKRPQMQATLRVLSFKGLLSPDLIKEFEGTSKIEVQLTEATDPEKLWEILEGTTPAGGAFDLVTLFSYQVPLAAQLGRVQPLKMKNIKGVDAISSDFRELSMDKGFQSVVPILWGVSGLLYDSSKVPEQSSWTQVLKNPRFRNRISFPASTAEIARLTNITADTKDLKRAASPVLSMVKVTPDFLSPMAALRSNQPPEIALISHGETAFPPADASNWKFVVPEEGGALWVLALALHHDAQNEPQAQALIEFLLSKDSSLRLAREFRQASTNKLVETEAIDAKLKPSYLRQIPLGKIILFKDFSRARELRELLSSAR